MVNEELNRRIAVEVMGEAQDGLWTPRPYSTSLEEALRALDKYLIDRGFDEGAGFISNYHRGMQPKWWAGREGVRRHGQTLPEAICNLLLALKEVER